MFNFRQQFDRWLQSSGFFLGWKFLRRLGVLSDYCKSDDNAHNETFSLGELGELQAKKFLQKLGYKIIAHGHRQRLGEIDLIALDGSAVVFVEVKTWVSDDQADPSSAVDLAKQDKITRTALVYLKRHRLLDQPARFDVISIVWDGSPARTPRIRHFKNAFEAVGRGQLFS